MSLYSGIVPNQLKIVGVVPIFKSRDTHNSSNYRPIFSVLPVFSTILECLIHNSFIFYFELWLWWTILKLDFVQNGLHLWQIMHAYDKIISSLDNKNHMLGICLDLSKAFTTNNHDIFFYKLSHIISSVHGLNKIPAGSVSWAPTFFNELMT